MSLRNRFVVLAILLLSCSCFAQSIAPAEASKHVGESETVCGEVAGVKLATNVSGSPTFLDFERPYPNQTFTAVIWQRDKVAVGMPPRTGVLCVTGVIANYRGKPEIVLHNRSDWSAAQSKLSNDRHYTNVDGQSIHSPVYSSGGVPAGATAQCADGTYSFSTHRRGTCSRHGGVAKWL